MRSHFALPLLLLLPLLPAPLIGAAHGLWLRLAPAPLHVSLPGDAVEARLSALSCGSR